MVVNRIYNPLLSLAIIYNGIYKLYIFYLKVLNIICLWPDKIVNYWITDSKKKTLLQYLLKIHAHAP